MKTRAVFMLLAVWLLASTAAADEFVVNGDFSAGASSWSSLGLTFQSLSTCGTSQGSCFTVNAAGYLGQGLALPSAATYTLSFLASNGTASPGSSLAVGWNGYMVNFDSSQTVGSFTQFSFTGLAPKSSGTTTLMLAFGQGTWALDGVSVQSESAPRITLLSLNDPISSPTSVPEPATLALIAIGTSATAAAARRRNKRRSRTQQPN